LEDIVAFIAGRVNMDQFSKILWGLILLDWSGIKSHRFSADPSEVELWPGAAYGLLKLCFSGKLSYGAVASVDIPLVPAIHHRGASGDGAGAVSLAARRLRASGLSPVVETVGVKGSLSRRLAASILFPISSRAITTMAGRVIRRSESSN
jgi:CRISPR-associated protein Csx17